MSTDQTTMVRLKDLPNYLRKNAPRRHLYVWLDVPNRDEHGAHGARSLANHMRVTLPAVCMWAEQMARGHGDDAHVEVHATLQCLFIG